MNLSEAEELLAVRPLEFVVVEGCALAQDRWTPSPRMLATHLERCGGDIRRVEQTLNRRCVIGHLLFEVMERPPGVFDTTSEVCAALAQTAELHGQRLRQALGERFALQAFVVEVLGTDLPEEEPSQICTTFHRLA